MFSLRTLFSLFAILCLLAICVTRSTSVRNTFIASQLKRSGFYYVGLEGNKVTWLSTLSIPPLSTTALSEQKEFVAYLDLSGAKVSGGDLAVLKSFPALEVLDLAKSDADDALVLTIPTDLPVNAIRLNDTQVSDLIIDHLCRMDRLRGVDVEGTAISEIALEKLTSSGKSVRK